MKYCFTSDPRSYITEYSCLMRRKLKIRVFDVFLICVERGQEFVIDERGTHAKSQCFCEFGFEAPFKVIVGSALVRDDVFERVEGDDARSCEIKPGWPGVSYSFFKIISHIGACVS